MLSDGSKGINVKRLLVNFAIELLIYGVLLTLYYWLALRFLASPLYVLFQDYIVLYAIVSLVLIVVQGVLLENLTHFLLDRVGLEKFE